MTILVLVLLGIAVNMLMGAMVWAALDGDGQLLSWYKSCPTQAAWLLCPLVLTLWPVLGVWMTWKALSE